MFNKEGETDHYVSQLRFRNITQRDLLDRYSLACCPIQGLYVNEIMSERAAV